MRSMYRLVGATLPLQLFLAAGWLRAGVEKIIDPAWWRGDALRLFLEEQHAAMLPWFRPISEFVFEPIAPVVAWVVLWMQVGIGACLILNRHVTRALWAGIFLNVCFVMAGRVNPSAFYLVMQIALLFAASRAVSERVAVRRAVAWLIPASLVAPFARTVHPAHVIDDPALMLSFMCVIAAVGTILTGVSPARLDRIVQRYRLSRWLAGSLGWRRNTESDTESKAKTTTAESAMRTRPSVDSFG